MPPTFGSSLSSQAGKDRIPTIVAKCIMEIDSRGMEISGLYRVSGVKSKVEKLCQAFESGVDSIDLSDVHPNVIANVLKLYFRLLPEPLLTFRLYHDFIKIAKEFPASTRSESDQYLIASGSSSLANSLSSIRTGYSQNEISKIRSLVKVVSKLPRPHYYTLGYLIHHLRRVADQSANNNMPSSNLGIVFGPTLLRTSAGGNSLSSLVDTVHQTRVIDLLITYSNEIFGNPFKVNSQGQILGFNLEQQQSQQVQDFSKGISKSYTQVMDFSSSPSGQRRGSTGFLRGVVKVLGSSTKRNESDTTRKQPNSRSGNERQRSQSGIFHIYHSSNSSSDSSRDGSMAKSGHSHFLSAATINVGGGDQNSNSSSISISNLGPMRSASSSAIPSAMRVTVPGTIPSVSGSTQLTDHSQHQQMRAYINELRRQFFMTPSENFTYIQVPRKESTDDDSESTTPEEDQATITASNSLSKLKRHTFGPESVVAQQRLLQQDDHNPQYAPRSSLHSNSSLRGLRDGESSLSRSASALNPFSPRPQETVTHKLPAPPRLWFMQGEVLSRSASAMNPFSPRPGPESDQSKYQRPKFV